MNGDIRAREILSRVHAETPVGVEVGVFQGETSAELLSRSPRLFLHLVDSYPDASETPDHYKASGDYHARLTRSQQDSFRNDAINAVARFSGRYETHWEDSRKVAASFPDDHFDFVFVDGAHDAQSVRLDLEAWAPKVKQGGILGGHDYGYEPLPGPKQAVDAAVERHGWTLELGQNFTWFVRL